MLHLGGTLKRANRVRLDNAARCVAGTSCKGGVCTPLSPVGTSCNGDLQCGYGLSCEVTMATQMCSAAPAPGSPCTQLCRDVGTTCKQSVCAPLGLLGDTCSQNADCSPYYACDQTTSKCVLGPGIGDACVDTMCFVD